jgi:hypothetical protein
MILLGRNADTGGDLEATTRGLAQDGMILPTASGRIRPAAVLGELERIERGS